MSTEFSEMAPGGVIPSIAVALCLAWAAGCAAPQGGAPAVGRRSDSVVEVSVLRLARSGAGAEAVLDVYNRTSELVTVDRVTLVTASGVVLDGSASPSSTSASPGVVETAARSAARGALFGTLSRATSGLGGSALGGALGGLAAASPGAPRTRSTPLLGVTLAQGGRTSGSVFFAAQQAAGGEIWLEYRAASEPRRRIVVPLGGR